MSEENKTIKPLLVFSSELQEALDIPGSKELIDPSDVDS